LRFFGFLRLSTSRNRLFAPRFPLCRSIEFCQPTLPSPRVRPLPLQVQPFGFRPRGLMKLNLPSLEGPRISRPKGHDLIENDNFVFPRAGVQVAARCACHRQQAGRWSDRRARTLAVSTLSYLVCEGPRGGRRGPRPAGYPPNIPEFRTEMPFLTDFLVWGYQICLLGIVLSQDVVFGQWGFTRCCGYPPCGSGGSLSRGH